MQTLQEQFGAATDAQRARISPYIGGIIRDREGAWILADCNDLGVLYFTKAGTKGTKQFVVWGRQNGRALTVDDLLGLGDNTVALEF